jgi:hypothetical protein
MRGSFSQRILQAFSGSQRRTELPDCINQKCYVLSAMLLGPGPEIGKLSRSFGFSFRRVSNVAVLSGCACSRTSIHSCEAVHPAKAVPVPVRSLSQKRALATVSHCTVIVTGAEVWGLNVLLPEYTA